MRYSLLFASPKRDFKLENSVILSLSLPSRQINRGGFSLGFQMYSAPSFWKGIA